MKMFTVAAKHTTYEYELPILAYKVTQSHSLFGCKYKATQNIQPLIRTRCGLTIIVFPMVS